MVMPWLYAGRRWVATRELQLLRYPEQSAVAQPVTAGCNLSTYWITADRYDDHMKWTVAIDGGWTGRWPRRGWAGRSRWRRSSRRCRAPTRTPTGSADRQGFLSSSGHGVPRGSWYGAASRYVPGFGASSVVHLSPSTSSGVAIRHALTFS